MSDEFGRFIFLGAGAIAVFSYLSVQAWASQRTAERTAIERLALYRKLADTPAESVHLVLARLREEDELRERNRLENAHRSPVDGAILVAVGVGLSIFFKAVAPNGGVWTLGLLPLLIGVVIIVSSLIGRSARPEPGSRSPSRQ
jgi:hypothetical protein